MNYFFIIKPYIFLGQLQSGFLTLLMLSSIFYENSQISGRGFTLYENTGLPSYTFEKDFDIFCMKKNRFMLKVEN
jgi:hypothetical protein